MPTVSAEPTQAVARELGAEYAGVGWWGHLYRAPKARRWYRLIPVKEVNPYQRETLDSWPAEPRRTGLVPLVASGPRKFAGHWYEVLGYETDAPGCFADVIAASDPGARLAAAASVLRNYPVWRESVGPGLVALPADIVLTRYGPMLLPLPDWGPPSLGHVFAERERLAALAPEAARGRPYGRRDPGLYALAIAVRGCLEALPEADPGRMLHRVAGSTLFADRRGEPRLPSWLQRVDKIVRVREGVNALTAARPPEDAPDARALAAAVDAACRVTDPVAAVRAVRAQDGPRPAIAIAHAALREQTNYELLLIAAELAAEELDDPLEALSLLDRAVAAEPQRPEAYERQLSIIGELWAVLLGWLSDAVDGSFVARLDSTARTAFDRLPLDRQRDGAHDLARCLIGQGRYAEANKFAYRWLHDDSTLMWWRFDLMLDFAETFLQLGRLDSAAQTADEIRDGLRRVRENGQRSRSEIHGHGLRLADLDRRILAVRKGAVAP